MVGFFIFGLNLVFTGRLFLGWQAEQDYRQGMNGTSHDLLRLSGDYLHTDLQTVVLLYFFSVLGAPAFAFMWHRYANHITGLANRLHILK